VTYWNAFRPKLVRPHNLSQRTELRRVWVLLRKHRWPYALGHALRVIDAWVVTAAYAEIYICARPAAASAPAISAAAYANTDAAGDRWATAITWRIPAQNFEMGIALIERDFGSTQKYTAHKPKDPWRRPLMPKLLSPLK